MREDIVLSRRRMSRKDRKGKTYSPRAIALEQRLKSRPDREPRSRHRSSPPHNSKPSPDSTTTIRRGLPLHEVTPTALRRHPTPPLIPSSENYEEAQPASSGKIRGYCAGIDGYAHPLCETPGTDTSPRPSAPKFRQAQPSIRDTTCPDEKE